MAEVRIKDMDEHEIDTILADDIDFEGQLTFKKPLMVKGKFKGEIRSESALYVGEKAVVEAKIESSLVSSKGRIRGDITGHSRVELASTAHVDGDISTPDFVVESGCKFNGNCNMSGQKKAASQHPQTQPQGQHGQPQGQHGQPQGQHGQPPRQQGPQGQQGSQSPQGSTGQPPHVQPQGQSAQQPAGQRPPQQSNPQSPPQGGNR